MAVTLTATELAEALGAEQALADRLLPVATAIVDDYAPHAPDALANEAAIRFAGYIAHRLLRQPCAVRPSAPSRSSTSRITPLRSGTVVPLRC